MNDQGDDNHDDDHDDDDHDDDDHDDHDDYDDHLVSDPVPSIPGLLKVEDKVEEENVKLFMLRNEAFVGEPFTKYISANDRYLLAVTMGI